MARAAGRQRRDVRLPVRERELFDQVAVLTGLIGLARAAKEQWPRLSAADRLVVSAACDAARVALSPLVAKYLNEEES